MLGMNLMCTAKGETANEGAAGGLDVAATMDTSTFDICDKKSQAAKSDVLSGRTMGKFATGREEVGEVAANGATNVERASPVLGTDK